MESARFDVTAKPERTANSGAMHCMLQNLLAEHFHLRVRRDTKSLPGYALAVDRGQSKLRAAVEPSSFPFEQTPGAFDHQVRINGRAVSMDYFAWRLSVLDLPVSDQTGLTGLYDLDLAFVEEVEPDILERRSANGHGIDTQPTIFEAIRTQLGLRLEQRRSPVGVIVIDSVERPDEN